MLFRIKYLSAAFLALYLLNSPQSALAHSAENQKDAVQILNANQQMPRCKSNILPSAPDLKTKALAMPDCQLDSKEKKDLAKSRLSFRVKNKPYESVIKDIATIKNRQL